MEDIRRAPVNGCLEILNSKIGLAENKSGFVGLVTVGVPFYLFLQCTGMVHHVARYPRQGLQLWVPYPVQCLPPFVRVETDTPQLASAKLC